MFHVQDCVQHSLMNFAFVEFPKWIFQPTWGKFGAIACSPMNSHFNPISMNSILMLINEATAHWNSLHELIWHNLNKILHISFEITDFILSFHFFFFGYLFCKHCISHRPKKLAKLLNFFAVHSHFGLFWNNNKDFHKLNIYSYIYWPFTLCFI